MAECLSVRVYSRYRRPSEELEESGRIKMLLRVAQVFLPIHVKPNHVQVLVDTTQVVPTIYFIFICQTSNGYHHAYQNAYVSAHIRAVTPPSIAYAAPVTKADSSEARYKMR